MSDENDDNKGLENTLQPDIVELKDGLALLGIEVTKYVSIHDIPVSSVIKSRDNPDGSRTYLCRDERQQPNTYYVITATKPTTDITEASKYFQPEE